MPIQDNQQTPLISEMIQREVAKEQPATSSPSIKQETHSALWPILATLGGGAADVVSTQRGLHRGQGETNPLLPQGRLANGLALSGSYLGTALLTKLLNDHGHDKLAKFIGYGTGIDGALSTLNNMGLMKYRYGSR